MFIGLEQYLILIKGIKEKILFCVFLLDLT